MINYSGLILTVIMFYVIKKYNKIPYLKEISPVLISGLAIIFILKYFHITYQTYEQSASFLTFLLIPATVALGYPLYENIDILKKNKRIIYCSFIVSTVFALLITYIIGEIYHCDNQILISMLPKSVTAPIAIEISKNMNGIPELTACTVVLTGIFGAIFGHKILKFLKVRNNTAIGLAIGCASHVIGTSKCIEKGNKKQIVMSTVALVISGILTVIITSLFIKIQSIFL